jgi:hypothetical protein
MLFTLLLVIPFTLAAVLFLYTMAGVLIHLRRLYIDGRTRHESNLAV